MLKEKRQQLISILFIGSFMVIAVAGLFVLSQIKISEKNANQITRLPMYSPKIVSTNDNSSEQLVTIDSFSTPLASLGMVNDRIYEEYLNNALSETAETTETTDIN